MDKSVLKKIIIENQEFINKTEVKKRLLQIDPAANYVFCGIRRSGKSFMLFQHIKELVSAEPGLPYVYLNFEDERLRLTTDDLDFILQAYRELYPDLDISKCYFFFDEIQEVAPGESKRVNYGSQGKSRELYRSEEIPPAPCGTTPLDKGGLGGSDPSHILIPCASAATIFRSRRPSQRC